MDNSESKKGQEVVPAQTEALPPAAPNSSSFTVASDGKGGLTVSLTNKPGEKKKLPRGSTAFRHA